MTTRFLRIIIPFTFLLLLIVLTFVTLSEALGGKHSRRFKFSSDAHSTASDYSLGFSDSHDVESRAAGLSWLPPSRKTSLLCDQKPTEELVPLALGPITDMQTSFGLFPHSTSLDLVVKETEETTFGMDGKEQVKEVKASHKIPKLPKTVPRTLIRTEAPGYNVFDKLYMQNGTIYLVVEDPKDEEVPDIKYIFSTGLASHLYDQEARDPTTNEIQIITPEKAKATFGSTILNIHGTTFFFNDAGSTLGSYSTFMAEVFFAAWYSYAQLDPSITLSGHTTLASPSLMMMPHADEQDWRDPDGLNAAVMKTIFPSMGYEYKRDFEERKQLGFTYVFERVVVVDRTAGHRGPASGGPDRWMSKMNSDVLSLPKLSPHWFQPIRKSLLSGFQLHTKKKSTVPVITYLSRQGEPTSLKPVIHDELMESLDKLNTEHGWEVNVISERLSLVDQFSLASRTDILIGPHSGALNHLIWMNPSKYSTLIEFFPTGSFTYDYALPAQALGIKHYAAWHNRTIDTVKEAPELGWEDMDSKAISINVTATMALIKQRLKTF